MKTNPYLLFLMLMVLSASLLAQDTSKLIITYDLKTGLLAYEKEKVGKIKNGGKEVEAEQKFNIVGDAGNVMIKLKNVNPFLYNIKITELQNIRMDATQVGEINNMEFFNVIAYEVKDLSYSEASLDITSGLYSSKEIKNKVIEIRSLATKISEAMSAVKLKEITQPVSDLNNQIASDSSLRDWEKSINMEKQKTEALVEEKSALENDLDKLVQESKVYNDRVLLYTQKVKDLKEHLKAVNNIAMFYRALLNMMYTDGDEDFKLIKLKKELLKSVFPAYTPNLNLSFFLNGIINQSAGSYSDLSEYYNSISNSFPSDSPIPAQLLKSFSSITNMVTRVKQEDLQKFIDHIDRTYNSINEKAMRNIYYANIINDDADFIRFNIQGTPVSGLPPSVNVRGFNVEVEVPIKGGVKIDLSTGLLNTFGLFNKMYRYEKNSDSSYSVIENKQKSYLNPNLGVMMHIYRRNSIRHFRYAGSVGIGLSDDQNVRYFAGVSAIYGRKQRFIISLGAVAGQVNYADESVRGRKNLTLSSEDLLKPIPNMTPSPYRIGAFLGFTFNLTGSNSDFTGKVNGRGK